MPPAPEGRPPQHPDGRRSEPGIGPHPEDSAIRASCTAEDKLALKVGYGVRTTTARRYDIKRIDLDYFAGDDEATMGPPEPSHDG